jgi:hypothetical protein
MRASRVSSWAMALTASAAAWTAHAATPAYPAFPTASDLPTVAAWLRAQTDADLGAVVGVGEESVFILEATRDTTTPPAIRATVRQEVINPEFAAALGGRSAVMVGDVDCERRRVFQRALDLYAGNNKQGAVRRLGAASDWQDVPPGTFMDNVVAAVCEPDYVPIFPSGQVAAAPAAPIPPVAVLGRPTERSPATSLRPVLQPRAPIPLIAPVAPAPSPAARPLAPQPQPQPQPQLQPPPQAVAASAPPAVAPRPAPPPVIATPADPDGPIVTQRTAYLPPAASAAAPSTPTPAPNAAPPMTVAAAPPPPPPPPMPMPMPTPAPAPVQLAAPPPTSEPAPTAGALGLRPLALGRAQIGSFTTADGAIAAWRALAAAHPQAMADKRQRIELSTATGATRFRAFVDGFAGQGAAEAFCRTLRAEGRDCIASE